MTTKYFSSLLLLLLIGGSVMAQTKEKAPKEKKDEIIIRKNPEAKEKMTIVIDGDNITVNGKPLSELKNEDIQVIRDKAIAAIPRIKGRIAPGLDLKRLSDGFASGVTRPLLGVASEKSEKGAKITDVSGGSAAEKAGLQKGDIITRVDDKHVIESSEDLYNAIGGYHPGDKVTITYLRDGKQMSAEATLGKTDAPQVRSFRFNNGDFNKDFSDDFNNGFNFDMPQLRNFRNMDDGFGRAPKLGVEIQDLEEGKGVKILDVNDGSAADKAGLKKDDIVTDINGKNIGSVDDLRAQLRGLKEGDTLKITYQRNGKTQTAEARFPRKLKTAEL